MNNKQERALNLTNILIGKRWGWSTEEWLNSTNGGRVVGVTTLGQEVLIALKEVLDEK